MKRNILIAIVFVLSLCFSFSAFAANEIIDLKLNNNLYTPGAIIELSGTLYSGTEVVDAEEINVTLDSTETSVTTESDGTFAINITAPTDEGEFDLILSYGDAILNITIEVSSISRIELALLSSGSEAYEIISFSDTDTAEITDDGGIEGTLTYANFVNNGTTYYVIAQQNDGIYDILFISNQDDFSTIKYQYLQEGSKISLNNIDYTVFYIDSEGRKAILLRMVEPLFYGTGSEWATLFTMLLNSSDGLLSETKSVSFEQLDENGEYENDTQITVRNGYSAQSIAISETAGMHDILIDEIAHIGYFVKTFSLSAQIKSTDGNLISIAQPGQTVVLTASVVDLNSGNSTSDAAVNAVVFYPDGTDDEYSLTANSLNVFTVNAQLDESLSGEYKVRFTANYSGSILINSYKFTVKTSEIFMEAFSPQKGEGNGLPTNSFGFLIVGGRDLSTNEYLNLSNITANCDETQIYIAGIYDDKNNNTLGVFNVYELSDFFTAANVPSWVRSDVEDKFGEEACAINFSTPAKSGTYRVEVEANVSGTIQKIKRYLDVTNLFVYGMPADCTTGSWSNSVAPGATACIKVQVYSSETGQQVSSADITNIALVEVYAEGIGIVTDKISNPALVTFSDGGKGISFATANNTLGQHFVKLRVNANISSSIVSGSGNAFYRTELWNAWVFPQCSDMFCSFGSDSTVTLRAEAFTAGFTGGKADLTITPLSIKNFDTGDNVALDSSVSSCTTVADNSSSTQNTNSSSGGRVMPAFCSLTLSAPTDGWKNGGHEIKLKAVDTSNNTMTLYSWFFVENYNFFAWNKNWEITQNQDLAFDITLKDFEGNDITADVTVDKVYYMGSEDKWMEPKEIDFTATPQSITGTGTYAIDSSNLSELRSGFYQIVLSADSEDAGSQTARAGFSIRSFVVTANPTNDNWERSYEIGGNMTINVSAFETINWMTYPPTGTPHNIANISVKKINKNGMYDSAYKIIGTIGETNDCDDTTSSCILTVPLTGFDQSQYDMVIEITDSEDNTVTTNYNFMTERYTITIPDIQDWRTVPASNKMTDKIIVTLSTDETCPSSSIDEPANVAICLYDTARLPTIYENYNEYQAFNKETVFLLDKTDSAAPKLYVNIWNESIVNSNQIHKNFTVPTSTVGPLAVGGLFNDSNGYEWNVTAIDVGAGEITLQSINGVIKTRTSQNPSTNEITVEYMYQYLVNKSLSKSGTFLYYGNDNNEDKLWDDEGQLIDLDGDGKYNCPQGENDHWGRTCEEYYLILSDRATAGVYDTALISPTRNMGQGVNSFDGFSGSGAGDIKINASANEIYLLNVIYDEVNGVGRYKMVMTTNRAGWAGRNLGLFQVGTESVKVPVMVASPSTKAGIANKTVVIRKLRTFDSMSFEETILPNPAMATTSASGIALLTVNLSGVPAGEYMLLIGVNESGIFVTAGNDWDNPKLELRSFSVSNLMGIMSQINSMVEWSVDNNNLFKYDSAEAVSGEKTLRLNCGQWNNYLNDSTLCHVDDWRFRELWLNNTDPANPYLFKDNTSNDWRLNEGDIKEGSEKVLNDTLSVTNEFGSQLSYRFSNVNLNIDSITINEGDTVTIQIPGNDCSFEITLITTNNETKTITWDVDQVCSWGSSWRVEDSSWATHDINQREFLWDLFNLSEVDEDYAVFNFFNETITLSSPVVFDDIEGQNPTVRIISDINETGYDLYVYNSIQRKTRDDWEGNSGMLDTVAVVNSTNDIVNTYAFGDLIPEIGNKAVVYGYQWERDIYLSNLIINGRVIYPLPWSCDEKKFYVGTFTEQELGFHLYDCGDVQGQPLSNQTYYLMLFDDTCDGTWQINRAKFDDDPIIDDSWARYTGCIDNQEQQTYCAYDYDKIEQGQASSPCVWSQVEGLNQAESWIDIGREQFPITITSTTNIDSGLLELFKVKSGVNQGENITELTLWAQAKNFDGTLINGTLTIDEATGMSFECGMKTESELNLTGSDNLTNGVGYLTFDLSELSSPDITIKFKVQDSANVNKYEFITKTFWYSPAQQQMMSQGGGGMGGEGQGPGDNQCGDMFKGGSSGGGGPGEGPCMDCDESMQQCQPYDETSLEECTDAGFGCVWLPTDYFGTGMPDKDKCVSCVAFDNDETTCTSLDYSDYCVWSPTEQLCDPIGGGPQ